MKYPQFHTHDISNLHFLVTGGAGFIGSHIVDYLLQYGAGKVRVLDDLSTGFKENIASFISHPNFEFLEGDICDTAICEQATQGIHYISHQAALGSVPRSIQNPLRTHAVNNTGFLNMLIAGKDAGVKRFVYAASSSTYGDSASLPKIEDNIGMPLSPYAVTKRVNELYAHAFAKAYETQAIGLRYFNVYGPKQSPQGAYAAVIPLFMQAARDGVAPIIHGDGLQSRDFTYVENAVQANMKAMFAPKNAVNQVYNVACGARCTLLDLWNAIQTEAHISIAPSHGPDRVGDIKHSLASIDKAKTLLDYDPKITWVEGVKRTWKTFVG